jgi:hypothetical protein
MCPFIVYWIRFYPKQRISQGKKKKGSKERKAGYGCTEKQLRLRGIARKACALGSGPSVPQGARLKAKQWQKKKQKAFFLTSRRAHAMHALIL